MEKPTQSSDTAQHHERPSIKEAQRAIHVFVPESAYERAKDAAYMSKMSFKGYMARLLSEAEAYDGPDRNAKT